MNLMELGINTIDDEVVVHPWAQSILDEQWCGRDERCGKVMFKNNPSFFPLLLQAPPANLVASRRASSSLATPLPNLASSDLLT